MGKKKKKKTQKLKVLVAQSVQLFQMLVVHQAPLAMEFSRQEYWSGYHSLLQGIFPTQRSNPDLPYCKQILYQLSHKGSLYLCASSLIYYVILNGAITSFSYCEKFHMKKYFHIFITYIYVKTLNEQ